MCSMYTNSMYRQFANYSDDENCSTISKPDMIIRILFQPYYIMIVRSCKIVNRMGDKLRLDVLQNKSDLYTNLIDIRNKYGDLSVNSGIQQLLDHNSQIK